MVRCAVRRNSGSGSVAAQVLHRCGHCKSLKPVWEKLAGEFGDPKKGVVIGHVDCTENHDLCVEYGVKSYPTLKSFKGGDPKEHFGGRSFDELKKYVDENLGAVCSTETLENCEPEQKAILDEWVAKTAEERAAKVDELEEQIEQIQAAHNELVTRIQAEFAKSKQDLADGVGALTPPLRCVLASIRAPNPLARARRRMQPTLVLTAFSWMNAASSRASMRPRRRRRRLGRKPKLTTKRQKNFKIPSCPPSHRSNPPT